MASGLREIKNLMEETYSVLALKKTCFMGYSLSLPSKCIDIPWLLQHKTGGGHVTTQITLQGCQSLLTWYWLRTLHRRRLLHPHQCWSCNKNPFLVDPSSVLVLEQVTQKYQTPQHTEEKTPVGDQTDQTNTNQVLVFSEAVTIYVSDQTDEPDLHRPGCCFKEAVTLCVGDETNCPTKPFFTEAVTFCDGYHVGDLQ